jgi:transcriptional regulator with XRE-family HTH domain
MRSVHTAEYRAFLRLLRRARKDAGMTQADVAKALGVPQSMVSRCESGERRVDVIELRGFARLYGREVEDFLPRGG